MHMRGIIAALFLLALSVATSVPAFAELAIPLGPSCE
jgi:hypothetical protein